MIDYIGHIRRDSARFADLISGAPGTTSVPSCPGWSMSDLAWHLTEVQYFWAAIVADLLDSPQQVPELTRPADEELPSLFATHSARLLEALQSRPPDAACWTWHDEGRSVGWVLRRQAHEALIHRVDAELGAGASSTVDTALANDGIDEILTVMLDATNIPEWSSFAPDGRTAAIIARKGPSWAVELGRFTGTSPQSGNTYDDPALRVLPAAPRDPSAILKAAGPQLDLWLWGRAGLDQIEISGDASAAMAIRAAAIDATQ